MTRWPFLYAALLGLGVSTIPLPAQVAGVFTDKFATTVPAHGVVRVRVIKS